DITERLPDVVDIVRSLDARSLVLDGEAIVADPSTGRPLAFQDSASEISAAEQQRGAVKPFFFDLLHHDGRDLIDEPVSVRRPLLTEVPLQWAIPSLVTADAAAGQAVLESTLASGHEGVVVKAVGSRSE